MTGQHYNSGTNDAFSLKVDRRELKDLLRRLKSGESVLVTGGRKIGKTVLLQQVKNHFEQQKSDATFVAVPLYQDLAVLTRPVTAAPFFDALSKKVPPAVNSLLKRYDFQGTCQEPPAVWRYDPSLEFTHYLNSVLNGLDDTLGRVIFIYLLDECEALLGAEQTHTLLGNLRALVGPETDHRVKLVVTGFRGIKEYKDPITGTSPFKNVLITLPLGLFSGCEFDELVRPLLETTQSDEQVRLRQQLWSATGGHPCIIQVLCKLLTGDHRPQDFDAACDTATKLLIDLAFTSWVERFEAEDHELFHKVLKGESSPGDSPLSVEFLQYCGVLTNSGDKLLAPCGLFNRWYEQQFEHRNFNRSLGRNGSPSERAGAIEDQHLVANGISPSGDAVVDSSTANKSYTLVMKGGSVKGLAYIGALKELEKYYSFDWFVGTSAGAIAALLLGVGYSTQELETILRDKNFKEFLDSSVARLPINLISKGGCYEARSFTKWLDELIAARIESFESVELTELPKRVTIYASRRNKSALVFDKHGPNSNTSASFAARCSMSIPFVFTPQRDQGLRVFDGGMQNNYPVGQLLKSNPGTEFIGLYLGHYYEGMAKEPWLLSDMLSIWTESVDVEALKQHKEKTVIIDPRPIKTIDFNLTDKEKEFLLLAGKAAALRFLLKKGLPNGPAEAEVKEAEEKTRKLRAEIQTLRARRRRQRWIKAFILLLVIVLSIFLYVNW